MSQDFNNSKEILTISSAREDRNMRADVFVSTKINISRSTAGKLIESGSVKAGDLKISKNYRLKGDEIFYIEMPEPESCEAKPENIPLNIIFEDDDLIVVNKPQGMVVHPAPGHDTGTLVSALLYHCGPSLSGIGGVLRPGIVHRIDRDTSGLIVAAKNDATHLSLSEQLASHEMSRIYYTIVVGRLKEDKGTVDKPIARHPSDRKKMAVARDSDPSSRHAVTHYDVIEHLNGFTYARMKLETGRTHQIRVHMSSIGHPVLGDETYGGNKTAFQKRHPSLFKGQCLHAGELSLKHPKTGEMLKFTCNPPENFGEILRLLRTLQ